VEGGEPRELRLDRDPGVEHLGGLGELAEQGDVVEVVHRAGADEGAAADVAPDQPVGLEHASALRSSARVTPKSALSARSGGRRSLWA
jgi:hypothetical protein